MRDSARGRLLSCVIASVASLGPAPVSQGPRDHGPDHPACEEDEDQKTCKTQDAAPSAGEGLPEERRTHAAEDDQADDEDPALAEEEAYITRTVQ